MVSSNHACGTARGAREAGRGVKPAHRGTHVGAGFLPALTLRVGNQDVCASRAQVGKPAATGRQGAGGAKAAAQEQDAGRKTCGYGEAGCGWGQSGGARAERR